MILNNNRVKDFLSINITARNLLNVNNVETISTDKLRNIESLFDPNSFYDYKKKLFWKWNQKNYQNNDFYLKRLHNLAKKLEINFYDYEIDILYLMEAKSFTKIRSLKTLETPYQEKNLANTMYFSYKDVYLYHYGENSLWIKEKFHSELDISKNELVFFDREKNEILDFYYVKDIKLIQFKNYGLVFTLNNQEKFLIRYYDNEIILISLLRIWKKTLFHK